MHDVNRLLKDLNDALGQDKQHLGFLLGAGCPAAVRVADGGNTRPLIPDIAGLTRVVTARLAGDKSFEALNKQFAEDGIKAPNVERMLTTVRNMLRVAGAGTTRGLNRDELAALEGVICKAVYDTTCAALPVRNTCYHKFCRWIRDVERDMPVSLFTTNYDLLVEQALEEEEVPFFDGFAGARVPFFDVRAMEDDVLPARWARVWKLHGSINWRVIDDGRLSVVREMTGVPTGGGLLIHPSELKYDQSRRMPYLAMFDRLRSFLRSPGAVLVTCGYSFADEHLNETIIQGLTGNSGATAFGLLFKKLEEEPTATALIPRVPANMSLLAVDKGVIRRRTEEWSDPDAPAVPGPGVSAPARVEFNLGDFGVFSDFVAGLIEARPSPPHGRA